MGEVATIEVERVFPGRKAGKSEVFDVRTADGKKFAAWGTIGETMHGIGSGSVTVEYELRPKNGYDNATILKIVGSGNGSTPTAPSAKKFGTDQRIARQVALKAAVEFITNGYHGNVEPGEVTVIAMSIASELEIWLNDEATVTDSFSLADTE